MRRTRRVLMFMSIILLLLSTLKELKERVICHIKWCKQITKFGMIAANRWLKIMSWIGLILENLLIKVLLSLLIMHTIVYCSKSSGEVFQFPEFDYKETSKNVCTIYWFFSDFDIHYILAFTTGTFIRRVWISMWTKLWVHNFWLSTNEVHSRMHIAVLLSGYISIRRGNALLEFVKM